MENGMTEKDNPFADMDSLRAAGADEAEKFMRGDLGEPPPLKEKPAKGKKPKGKIPRWKPGYIMLGIDWQRRLWAARCAYYPTWAVALRLAELYRMEGKRTVKLSNADMKERCVDRWAKIKGMRQLAALNLIKLTSGKSGQSPSATWRVNPNR
jgi:hypothetical protein